MTKVIVTGHLGFIGSHLTSELKGLNWIGFDLEEGKDIRNEYQVYEAFDFYRPDVVIHLAALAGVRRGEEYPQEYISTNVLGTLNLLKVSEKFKIKKFINFSSSSVFGDAKPPINEEFDKNPKSIYGLSKLMAEKLCEMSPLVTITVRPFTVYGINGRPDMVIYRWLDQIKQKKAIDFYGDGTSKRGYIHIEDLINGVIFLLNNINFSTSYNLGGQEIVSLDRLCKIFKKHFKKNLKINYLPSPSSDIYQNWSDISKAKKELRWIPKMDFEKELDFIIKNYKKSEI